MKVLSAKFNNAEKTSFDVTLVDESGVEFEGKPFDYTVLTERDDTDGTFAAELHKQYLAGEIVPDEYVEPVISDDDLAVIARDKRNSLLSDTDFLVQPDYPLTDDQREAIKAYRQALRDITNQEGFPRDIEWPEKPSVLKG